MASAVGSLIAGIRSGLPVGMQLGFQRQESTRQWEELALQRQRETRMQEIAERQEKIADRKIGLDYIQGLGNIFRAKMSPQLRGVVLKSYLGQAEQFTGKPIGEDVVQAMTKASDDDQKLIMEGFTEMLQGDPSIGAKQLLAAGEDINTLLPFIMQGQKLKAAREEAEYTQQVLSGGPGAPIPPTPGAGAPAPPTGRPGMAPLPAGRIVPPSAEQLRGPTRYREMIIDLSREQGVDPRLIEAMVGVESGGNPQAVSSAGARGLMQLLPETGQQYGVAAEQAFIPALNLRGGIAHFKQLLDRYGGNVETALTAYHSGEGNVDRGTIGPRGRAYAPAVLARYQALGGRAAPPPTRPAAAVAVPMAAPVSARPEVAATTGGPRAAALTQRLAEVDAEIGRLLRLPKTTPAIEKRTNNLEQQRNRLFGDLEEIRRQQAEARQQAESISTPQGYERQLALRRETGAAAAEIQVEKEQTKPIAEDATKWMHRETLQHPSAKLSRRQLAEGGEYIPLDQATQKATREMKASLASFTKAISDMQTMVANNPKIWTTNTYQQAIAAIRENLGIARVDPATRPIYAKMDAIRASRARLAKAFGDVGNLAQQEQLIQEEALSLRAGYRDVAETRLEELQALLEVPVREHFESLGLTPPTFGRAPQQRQPTAPQPRAEDEEYFRRKLPSASPRP
jgi:Transglycosylase SLT domain